MRHGSALFLSCLFLTFGTGCMVLDEVDAANAKMGTAEPASAPAAAPQEAAENPLVTQSKQWWENVSSFSTSDGVDSSIVNCRLQSGSQFMSRDDCVTRGGVATSL